MSAAIRLSIIVPTFNERDNIPVLIGKLEDALKELAWEVIFVDDNSGDKTSEVVRKIAARKPNVRCLLRIGRRGLSGACIEGMLSSSAPFVAVMDADCQHDETCLVKMLEILEKDKADLAVGSRYATGSKTGDFSKIRLAGSRISTLLAKSMLGIELSDPMSGFFMIKREKLTPLVPQLSSQGFKILLDIVASARGQLRIAEIAFVFGTRAHGQSKMDSLVAMDLLGLLVAKFTHNFLPVRFLYFLLIGSLSLIVHLLILKIELQVLNVGFIKAHAFAAFLSAASNFFINNQFTYQSHRLKGAKKLLRGLRRSYTYGSLGIFVNVATASITYQAIPVWWLAASVGAIMGFMWNYFMSLGFIWRTN
jgi:dolichol-phosphate mannosyltransferase